MIVLLIDRSIVHVHDQKAPKSTRLVWRGVQLQELQTFQVLPDTLFLVFVVENAEAESCTTSFVFIGPQ